MTKQQRFKELTSNLTRKIDFKKYPDSIYFFKEDKCYFEYNIISSYLWCNYDRVWKVFYDEFQMEWSEVQSFIKDQLEQHFKLRSVTPRYGHPTNYYLLEQHFKLRSVTPALDSGCNLLVVEQHFK